MQTSDADEEALCVAPARVDELTAKRALLPGGTEQEQEERET